MSKRLPPSEAEVAFGQANYSRTGAVTPGELLCHMCVECGGSRPSFADCFLIMDLDGDGRIDYNEWMQTFKRCSQYGLRAKPLPPAAHSPAELKSLDEEGQGLMKPKIDMLRSAFDALDLDKDGKVSSRELAAFQAVLDQRTRAEAVAAALDAAGDDPKALQAAATMTRSDIKLDARTAGMVGMDADAALASFVAPSVTRHPKGEASLREENGYSSALSLDFARFKSLLMRHAAAIEASAAAGASGGKKGKKKK